MLSEFSQGLCPPCPNPFNMAGYVLEAGLRTPDKIALIIAGRGEAESWSFAEMRAAILGTATGFQRAGLAPGAKVLMRLGNTVDFPIAFLAALVCDAVPVPTASALTRREVDWIAKKVQPAVIVHDPDVDCPQSARVMPLTELRSFRDLPPAQINMGEADRLGYIVFTSGTSGEPHAVCHAHRAIWARQMMFDGWYGMRPTDRVMHAGAFNWTFTLGTGLMDPWTMGATAIIPAKDLRPEELPELMERHQATLFAAAPGVYRKMLKTSTDLAIPSLRHGLSAGEKLSGAIAKAWTEASGTPLLEAYGMSECSTFISHPPDAPGPIETLGQPQNGRKIAILQDGNPVPIGSEGTIAVHSSDCGLMLGYLDAEDATKDRFTGDWFLTGDQGAMDQNGFITYLGRHDDMMNAGGFRVSPIEVEHVLAHMPGVDAVAVAEVWVKEDASVIGAFYTGSKPLDDAAWRSYMTERLARYKQPRMFVHMSELPMGTNGKILRRALRDQVES